MLWSQWFSKSQMSDYDKIKKDLVEYIKVCEVKEIPLKNGIGPFEQRHKKFLKESYPTLFANDDNETFNKVKDFCMQMTLEVAPRCKQRLHRHK